MAKSISVQEAYKQFGVSVKNAATPDEPPATQEPAAISAPYVPEPAERAQEESAREHARPFASTSTTLKLYKDQRERVEIILNSERGASIVGIIREALDEWLDNHGWSERLDDETLAQYAECRQKIASLGGSR